MRADKEWSVFSPLPCTQTPTVYSAELLSAEYTLFPAKVKGQPIMLYHFLLLQWLVIQSVHGNGIEDAAEDSVYGLPLLYHYGSCSHHSESALSVHFINTLDYTLGTTHVSVLLLNDGSTPTKSKGTYYLDPVATIPLLLPDKSATSYDQCLRYHCGGGGTKNTKVCTRDMRLTGVKMNTLSNDPTTLASLVTRETDFVNVLSLMPLTQTGHYTYYTLHGRRRGQYTLPTVGLLQLDKTGNTKINVTIHKDTLVYKNKMLVEGEEWKNLSGRYTVWLQDKDISLYKIVHNQPLSVFTGFATANNSHFSYHTRYAQQMPATSQWGTVFIADVTTIIEKFKDVNVSFSILTSNASTVHIIDSNQNTQSFQMEAESLKVIVLENSIFSSHITIKSTQKVLILYEAYRETAEENDTIFSTFLQPTEWYTYKQAATLTTPSQAINTTQHYIITIAVPKDTSIYVSTNTSSPTNLSQYENITLLPPVDVTDYTLYTVTHHPLHTDSEKVLLFTASDVNGCSAVLGVTVYTPHYAHTNPPPLNDSNSQRTSAKCRRLADPTPTIVAVSSSVVTLLLLLILITLTVTIVLVTKPRILFQKPDPPFQDFDYDVFLSFADGDKDLVTTLLYLPLRNRGYKVLWHLSDFIAGLSIAENMLTAIQRSRWVIYACSEHFEESQFCQQELRMGLDDHYRVHKGRYRRVIPLVLQGGTCPHKLKQLYPIQTHYERQTPTNRNINRLIKRLCFGQPLDTKKSVLDNFLPLTDYTTPALST